MTSFKFNIQKTDICSFMAAMHCLTPNITLILHRISANQDSCDSRQRKTNILSYLSIIYWKIQTIETILKTPVIDFISQCILLFCSIRKSNTV